MSASNELLRGSVWSFRSLDTDEPKPVVIVSNDGRNRSRFEWVHIVRITSRPKRPLPTVIELGDADAPLTGRLMADELELVRKDGIDDRRGMLSRQTMRAWMTPSDESSRSELIARSSTHVVRARSPRAQEGRDSRRRDELERPH